MVTELVEAHAGTASINDMAATKFFIDFTFPADPARQQKRHALPIEQSQNQNRFHLSPKLLRLA
jgi:hypothetical protein